MGCLKKLGVLLLGWLVISAVLFVAMLIVGSQIGPTPPSAQPHVDPAMVALLFGILGAYLFWFIHSLRT